jgi:hypothetical protein
MTTPTFSTTQSISELRDQQSIYLKALQILIQDGTSMEKAQKTVCWNRLSRLHEAMPNQYLNPEHLFLQMLADTATINPSKRKSR